MKIGITILEHGYQRNGVGGIGFYYFRIKFKDNSGKTRKAIATLTVDHDEHPEKFNGSCRVITPDNLSDHWRGDRFEEEIRQQCEEWR